jgi:hypothetical protein
MEFFNKSIEGCKHMYKETEFKSILVKYDVEMKVGVKLVIDMSDNIPKSIITKLTSKEIQDYLKNKYEEK